jgi:hypothetical protein
VSGIHIVGPAGYHEPLLRKWRSNGLQLITHVKPEPGDGARLRAWCGDAFLAWRFTDNTGLRDAEVEARYMADPVGAAYWLWEVFGPMLAQNPEYNTVLVNNEPTQHKSAAGLRKLCDFTRACVDVFNAQGWGVGLFSFARGNPEPLDWTNQYLIDTWRYALSRNAALPAGRTNILSIHQYGSWSTSGAGSLFEDEVWHLKRPTQSRKQGRTAARVAGGATSTPIGPRSCWTGGPTTRGLPRNPDARARPFSR